MHSCNRFAACIAAAVLLTSCTLEPHQQTGLESDSLTAFVVVDDASVASLGKAPLNRAIYAKAIEKAAEMGARAVVLKFFFGDSSNSASDQAVAESMSRIPVLMQVFPGKKTADLPRNLVRADWRLNGISKPLVLHGVALPVEPFADRSIELGFVQARLDDPGHKVEVAAKLGDYTVAALQIAALEVATGQHAVVKDAEFSLGSQKLPLDETGRLTCDTSQVTVHKYSIEKLLNNGVARDAIRGKVVVIGYDRSDSPTANVGADKVPVHTMFYRQLACVAQMVAQPGSQSTVR